MHARARAHTVTHSHTHTHTRARAHTHTPQAVLLFEWPMYSAALRPGPALSSEPKLDPDPERAAHAAAPRPPAPGGLAQAPAAAPEPLTGGAAGLPSHAAPEPYSPGPAASIRAVGNSDSAAVST